MNTKVERCDLAPGFSISRVLTGMWQVADMERDGVALDIAATASAMTPYADAGFTTFDMGDRSYGSAEIVAGQFRKQRASGQPVQMLTKWLAPPGQVTRADVQAAVQSSLDRLQADCIDLLQFHTWNYADPNYLDSLYWLQDLKARGLIRHLGLTNVDTAHLRIILQSGIDIVSNQVSFSLLDQRARQGMTELCLNHGVKLLCFGTVAGGFFSERWLDKPEPGSHELTTWSQMKYKRFIDAAGGWQVFQELLRVVASVGRRHGVSIANIASRYILEQPAVGGVIIGSRLGKSEHIGDNRRLFEFSLDETSRAIVSAALGKLKSIPGDCGDEYRRPPFLTASGDLSHHLEALPRPYSTQSGADGRCRVLSGTEWEDIASFSRAVRAGNHIFISGTTATHCDRAIGGKDPVAQLHFVIDKIEGALNSLGARLQDVVRTRVYVSRLADWQLVARAHGERFRGIQPANMIVAVAPLEEEYLVEMEAEAVVME